VRLQLERPLDRYLEPLAVALALRTSLTQEPEGAEEEAVALVERSKESRNPSIKKDLLGRYGCSQALLPICSCVVSIQIVTSMQLFEFIIRWAQMLLVSLATITL
jgi:hypothetical protein